MYEACVLIIDSRKISDEACHLDSDLIVRRIIVNLRGDSIIIFAKLGNVIYLLEITKVNW